MIQKIIAVAVAFVFVASGCSSAPDRFPASAPSTPTMVAKADVISACKAKALYFEEADCDNILSFISWGRKYDLEQIRATTLNGCTTRPLISKLEKFPVVAVKECLQYAEQYKVPTFAAYHCMDIYHAHKDRSLPALSSCLKKFQNKPEEDYTRANAAYCASRFVILSNEDTMCMEAFKGSKGVDKREECLDKGKGASCFDSEFIQAPTDGSTSSPSTDVTG